LENKHSAKEKPEGNHPENKQHTNKASRRK